MKKSAIFILLTVTLIFIAFVSGVYVGRNFPYGDTIVRGETPASSTVSSPPNTPASKPADVGSSTDTGTAATPVFPININTATAEELDLLPDIGPKRAQAIVAYRQAYGPFSAPEDLLHVDGIGEIILEKIRPYITV